MLLKLVMSLAENQKLKDDLKKAEIHDIEARLAKAQDVENDFNEFVEFALDFIDDLKANWWMLDYEDRLRYEQLLFPLKSVSSQTGYVFKVLYYFV